MNNMIISPILYMGSKRRLIRRGLIDLFPNRIHTFIDAFAGSAIVSMNTHAQNYIINDIDDTLHTYYQLFSTHCDNEIIKHIKQRIDEFDLPKKSTIRRFMDKNELEKYKKSYHHFRDNYNKNKNMLDLYTLMFFAFSQQFRVNKNGDFNMPLGNNCFSPKNEKSIVNGCDFFSCKNLIIYKEDFSSLFNNIKIDKQDFIYLDPPYSITTATYTENAQWGIDDDLRLFQICENLNKQNICFGMSNILLNKGRNNLLLRDFCKDNDFTVFSPDNFQYNACGKENKQQQEVFICNYIVLHNQHHFSLVNI